VTDTLGAVPVSPTTFSYSRVGATDEMVTAYRRTEIINAAWTDAEMDTWVNAI